MMTMMMSEHYRAIVGDKLYYVYKWRCALGAFRNWQLLGTLLCCYLGNPGTPPCGCSVCLSLSYHPCSLMSHLSDRVFPSSLHGPGSQAITGAEVVLLASVFPGRVQTRTLWGR